MGAVLLRCLRGACSQRLRAYVNSYHIQYLSLSQLFPPPGTYRSGAISAYLLGCMVWYIGMVWQMSVVARLQLFSWTGANEAVGNVKLFNVNNLSGSGGLPHFTKGIYWTTCLFLRTPFAEGCAGANKKASPPGRHRNRRLNSVAPLDPLRSVQFSSKFSS